MKLLSLHIHSEQEKTAFFDVSSCKKISDVSGPIAKIDYIATRVTESKSWNFTGRQNEKIKYW